MRSDEVTPVPPPPPPEEPTKPVINRVLGATSGDNSGNVRAVLAIGAMLFLHGLFGLLLVAYFRGSATDLKDFVLTTGAGIVTLDTGAIGFYFGKRSAESG